MRFPYLDAPIRIPVSMPPAVRMSVVPARRFPIVNVPMVRMLELESVYATKVVNAVGLKPNVRRHVPRETFWSQTMAMSVSATVQVNLNVSVRTMPLMTLADVHKAHGHVR